MAKSNIVQSISPVVRESITSVIVNRITDLLISQELKPGDQLATEMELAQQLNVGRNSVREAIKMLSYLGIIEIRRGIGTFVAESMPPSVFNPMILGLILEKKTPLEIIELRIFIETAISEIAFHKADDKDIKKLEKVNYNLKKAAESKKIDIKEMARLDIKFHETIMDLTDNAPLIKIGKAIYALFFNSISKTVEENPMLAVSNHQLVIDAFKARDIDLLRKHLRKSLAYWEDFIKK